MFKTASKIALIIAVGLLFTSAANSQNAGRVKAAVSTMPDEMKAGETITVTATVTNLGNETWSSENFDAKELGPFDIRRQFKEEWKVDPGNSINLNYSVTAPKTTGKQKIRLVFYNGTKKVLVKTRTVNVVDSSNPGEVK